MKNLEKYGTIRPISKWKLTVKNEYFSRLKLSVLSTIHIDSFQKWPNSLTHRDKTRASTLFSAIVHVKSLLIMGPNNIKNSSLKCDFHIINYE